MSASIGSRMKGRLTDVARGSGDATRRVGSYFKRGIKPSANRPVWLLVTLALNGTIKKL